MVRGFTYRGEAFRATVHGRPGKEEIFIVMMVDDEEGPEISIDRFEDADNNPDDALETMLCKLVDKLFAEQSITPASATEEFAWLAPVTTGARVHDGVQQH
ncbi:hypothetical protein [Derxia gummosa]|uniref:Uncharacterized protein n=1 Tax=Derxia gummosa DSM 723 TaxID=1121388 RepID=A0A8B6X416_9BURK|nr:hypothetical protein [Derxia gummosa]